MPGPLHAELPARSRDWDISARAFDTSQSRRGSDGIVEIHRAKIALGGQARQGYLGGEIREPERRVAHPDRRGVSARARPRPATAPAAGWTKRPATRATSATTMSRATNRIEVDLPFARESEERARLGAEHHLPSARVPAFTASTHSSQSPSPSSFWAFFSAFCS